MSQLNPRRTRHSLQETLTFTMDSACEPSSEERLRKQESPSLLLALPDDVTTTILRFLTNPDDWQNVRLTCRRLRDLQTSVFTSLKLFLSQADDATYLTSTVPGCLERCSSLSRFTVHVDAPFKVHMARNSLGWAAVLKPLLQPLPSLTSLCLHLAEAGYAWEHENWSSIAASAR